MQPTRLEYNARSLAQSCSVCGTVGRASSRQWAATGAVLGVCDGVALARVVASVVVPVVGSECRYRSPVTSAARSAPPRGTGADTLR